MKRVIVSALILCCLLGLAGCGQNDGKAEHVIGYSALYSDELIEEACRIVESHFSKEFKGCTLKEIRYDDKVENRFMAEIEKAYKENNSELIVLLSTFETDKNGGDGSLNPNETYTDWQWHLVRTPDKKSWEIIDWGYG